VTASAPLIIGATGGSGTRVVARIARHAGYDLGRNVNSAGDALEFYSFYDKWVNRFAGAERKGRRLAAGNLERMRSEFQSASNRHRPSNSQTTHWGWKAPRSIYLLSFLHDQFPNLKFIHVVRDGRDMALSRNQNQLNKHGAAVLGWSERLFRSRPERSILLWERVNLQAAEFGESKLHQDYLRVRFEDLCEKPVETTAHLINFLGALIDPEAVARDEVSPPSTLQRWQTYPPALIAKLEQLGGESLRKFGYLA
jgi:Sulfotransferase family